MPTGDMIIHAGDISSVGEIWDVENFVNWYDSLDYEYKIFIAGNHDFFFEQQSTIVKDIIPNSIIYLEDSLIVIEGIKIYGTPHTSLFNNWAFNRTDKQRQELWKLIPKDTDILVSHGPVFDILDYSPPMGTWPAVKIGCSYMKDVVLNKVKPDIFICGHAHDSFGHKNVNGIDFYNVSILDGNYQFRNHPVTIDYDKK